MLYLHILPLLPAVVLFSFFLIPDVLRHFLMAFLLSSLDSTFLFAYNLRVFYAAKDLPSCGKVLTEDFIIFCEEKWEEATEVSVVHPAARVFLTQPICPNGAPYYKYASLAEYVYYHFTR